MTQIRVDEKTNQEAPSIIFNQRPQESFLRVEMELGTTGQVCSDLHEGMRSESISFINFLMT